MKNIKEIISLLNTNRQILYSKYSIKSLAIFGSYARKENNEQSDLDLIVEFKDKIGVKFIDLADELESILGLKIDLVSKNGIKEKYFKTIESDLIYV